MSSFITKKFINVKQLLDLECPIGHKIEMKYNNFQQGDRCGICWKEQNYSRSEKEVLSIVKKSLPNEKILENDRTQIINPKTGWNIELDIYLPNLNKAIEFNGIYFHGDDFPDTQYKDKIKKLQCKEKGINLLVIEERNWIDDKYKCIDEIKKFLNGVNFE